MSHRPSLEEKTTCVFPVHWNFVSGDDVHTIERREHTQLLLVSDSATHLSCRT